MAGIVVARQGSFIVDAPAFVVPLGQVFVPCVAIVLHRISTKEVPAIVVILMLNPSLRFETIERSLRLVRIFVSKGDVVAFTREADGSIGVAGLLVPERIKIVVQAVFVASFKNHAFSKGEESRKEKKGEKLVVSH